MGGGFFAGDYDNGLQTLTEVQTYTTDPETYSDKVEVELISGNRIKGNFNFTGIDEDTGETVEMKGTFDVQPEG